VPRSRLWSLVGLVALLGACAVAPAGAPDPAATEAAIQAAVAATATALTTSQPEAPAAPTTAPAPAAAPTAAPAPAASPTPAAIAATKPAAPTVAPTPATPRPAVTRTPLTSDEAAYLRSLRPLMQEFDQSFNRFAALWSEPNPEDASWRLGLSAELQLWADAAEAARNVRPPASMQPVHQKVVSGLELYGQAAKKITDSIQATDEAGLREGLETVRQARMAFLEANREIDRIAQERGL
jgi:hypothetical protein